jgi:hypothetical protein
MNNSLAGKFRFAVAGVLLPLALFTAGFPVAIVSGAAGQRGAKQARELPADVIRLTTVVAPSNADVIYMSTARHGLFRSDDAGTTWQMINHGLPPGVGAEPVTPIGHLVVDPKRSEVVYAATETKGMYKTEDGGQMWQAANTGLPVPLPYRTYAPLLAIHPRQPRVLYMVIGHPVHSHQIENKLYKSTDGARQWQYLAHLPNVHPFYSLSLRVLRSNEVKLTIEHEQGVIEVVDDPFEGRWQTSKPTTTDRQLAATDAAVQQDFDAGQIAILHDDGTLFHQFDLHGVSIQFERTGDTYSASRIPFTFDSDLGQRLALENNDSTRFDLPFEFNFYQTRSTRIFVNSNGNLTFTSGSNAATPSTFSTLPRINGLWVDLDPTQGGGVFVRSTANQVVFTWFNVPERNKRNSNTIQVQIFPNHRILISFNQVQARTGLTGITNALAVSPMLVDFSDELPLTNVRRAILESFDGSLETDTVARRFYQRHPDSFDLLTAFAASNTPVDVVPSGAFAFYQPIRNDARGIGFETGEFNGGPRAFGSAGRLQGFLNMNKLSEYPDNPTQSFLRTNSTLDVLAQETGHRWLAFVRFKDGDVSSDLLLGRDQAHWSFFHNTNASELEGNLWVDNGNGTFTSIEATTRFSPLDLYLMGLASPFEVSTFFFIREDPTMPSGRSRGSPPEVGVTVKGTRQTVTITQVIQAEGGREPGFPVAPSTFNQAFILVVPQGGMASSADLSKLDNIRQSWEVFFRIATNGRGRINTNLGGIIGAADLIPTNLFVSPTTVTPGSAATVNVSIANQGTIPAGPATHHIRFSDDSIIDSSDPLVGVFSTGDLPPGTASAFTFSIGIPPGTPAGTRFIGVQADTGNAVAETNEGNNTTIAAITVTGGGFGADLVPVNLSVNPSTVPASGTTTVSVTILNQGSTTAPSATHEIRLSTDSFVDRNDTFLASFITGDIPPGASLTFAIGVVVPPGTPPGGRFLGVIADALSVVAETNEANNTISVFITVTP